MRRAFANHGFDGQLTDEELGLFSRFVAANDYAAFDRAIGSRAPFAGLGGIHFRDSLWADLATLRGLSQYQTATFEVPPIRNPRLLIPDQTPVLQDDKKTQMVVT